MMMMLRQLAVIIVSESKRSIHIIQKRRKKQSNFCFALYKYLFYTHTHTHISIYLYNFFHRHSKEFIPVQKIP